MELDSCHVGSKRVYYSNCDLDIDIDIEEQNPAYWT